MQRIFFGASFKRDLSFWGSTNAETFDTSVMLALDPQTLRMNRDMLPHSAVPPCEAVVQSTRRNLPNHCPCAAKQHLTRTGTTISRLQDPLKSHVVWRATPSNTLRTLRARLRTRTQADFGHLLTPSPPASQRDSFCFAFGNKVATFLCCVFGGEDKHGFGDPAQGGCGSGLSDLMRQLTFCETDGLHT